MKLSELIREYVDLKIEGEPAGSEWESITERSKRRYDYHARIELLEEQIDDAVGS